MGSKINLNTRVNFIMACTYLNIVNSIRRDWEVDFSIFYILLSFAAIHLPGGWGELQNG